MLDLYFDMLPMDVSMYNQTLAGVRSTGAGIKCRYCMISQSTWVIDVLGVKAKATTIMHGTELTCMKAIFQVWRKDCPNQGDP